MGARHRPETIFDRAAEDYDAARPGYPEALVETVLARAALRPGDRILEIGAGTGKATRPFARRGHPMTCIEPGDAMRAVAERHLRDAPQVSFFRGSFEDWPVEAGAFRLAICGQAWHWLDPNDRVDRVARALAPGGRLAVFWNRPRPPEPALGDALQACYLEHAPELASVRPHVAEEALRGASLQLERDPRFGPLERLDFPWVDRQTEASYLRLLGTHSDHLRLPEPTRRTLYAAIAQVVRSFGGEIELPQAAQLYLFQRLGAA